jgi:large subunit ribosomal protein L5
MAKDKEKDKKSDAKPEVKDETALSSTPKSKAEATPEEKREQRAEAKAKAKAAASGKKHDAGGGTTFEVQKERPRGPSKPPRLKTIYMEKAVPALMKNLAFKNKMQVPRLTKVVVSSCLKEALINPKALDNAVDEIAAITGQKPKITRSKKSIAAFKLREGQAIGAVVTLRRAHMYEFFDRLVNVALPRVRDFKGLNPKSFDGRGNYSLGLKEQIIFPEINYDRIDKIRGMNVTIGTNAKKDEHALALLTELGMPFKKA